MSSANLNETAREWLEAVKCMSSIGVPESVCAGMLGCLAAEGYVVIKIDNYEPLRPLPTPPHKDQQA